METVSTIPLPSTENNMVPLKVVENVTDEKKTVPLLSSVSSSPGASDTFSLNFTNLSTLIPPNKPYIYMRLSSCYAYMSVRTFDQTVSLIKEDKVTNETLSRLSSSSSSSPSVSTTDAPSMTTTTTSTTTTTVQNNLIRVPVEISLVHLIHLHTVPKPNNNNTKGTADSLRTKNLGTISSTAPTMNTDTKSTGTSTSPSILSEWMNKSFLPSSKPSVPLLMIQNLVTMDTTSVPLPGPTIVPSLCSLPIGHHVLYISPLSMMSIEFDGTWLKLLAPSSTHSLDSRTRTYHEILFSAYDYPDSTSTTGTVTTSPDNSWTTHAFTCATVFQEYWALASQRRQVDKGSSHHTGKETYHHQTTTKKKKEKLYTEILVTEKNNGTMDTVPVVTKSSEKDTSPGITVNTGTDPTLSAEPDPQDSSSSSFFSPPIEISSSNGETVAIPSSTADILPSAVEANDGTLGDTFIPPFNNQSVPPVAVGGESTLFSATDDLFMWSTDDDNEEEHDDDDDDGYEQEEENNTGTKIQDTVEGTVRVDTTTVPPECAKTASFASPHGTYGSSHSSNCSVITGTHTTNNRTGILRSTCKEDREGMSRREYRRKLIEGRIHELPDIAFERLRQRNHDRTMQQSEIAAMKAMNAAANMVYLSQQQQQRQFFSSNTSSNNTTSNGNHVSTDNPHHSSSNFPHPPHQHQYRNGTHHNHHHHPTHSNNNGYYRNHSNPLHYPSQPQQQSSPHSMNNSSNGNNYSSKNYNNNQYSSQGGNYLSNNHHTNHHPFHQGNNHHGDPSSSYHRNGHAHGEGDNPPPPHNNNHNYGRNNNGNNSSNINPHPNYSLSTPAKITTGNTTVVSPPLLPTVKSNVSSTVTPHDPKVPMENVTTVSSSGTAVTGPSYPLPPSNINSSSVSYYPTSSTTATIQATELSTVVPLMNTNGTTTTTTSGYYVPYSYTSMTTNPHSSVVSSPSTAQTPTMMAYNHPSTTTTMMVNSHGTPYYYTTSVPTNVTMNVNHPTTLPSYNTATNSMTVPAYQMVTVAVPVNTVNSMNPTG